MANDHKKSAFTLILLGQSALVPLGLAMTYWLSPVRPVSKLNYLVAVSYGILLAVSTLLVLFLVYRYGQSFARTLSKDIRLVSNLFVGYRWWQIFLVTALAGLGEELLFRAFLQNWLAGYWGVALAIGVTSLIFGLLHYLSFVYFVSAFLMSILFGVGYVASGSLLMTMVWHGVYDLMALWILMRYPWIFQVNSLDCSKM